MQVFFIVEQINLAVHYAEIKQITVFFSFLLVLHKNSQSTSHSAFRTS
jgi:hypothetical protein